MFTIQLGHPKIKLITPKEFPKLQDIFLPLFRANEESLFIYWNDIPIRFRYREDLYWSFNEMLAMVWMLLKESNGKTKVNLKNQVLKAQLRLHWEEDNLELEGTFEAFEAIYSPYARSLSKQGAMQLSKNQFLAEWKTLLHQIIVSIEASKCTIEDGVERRRMELLLNVEKSIESYGRLYVE